MAQNETEAANMPSLTPYFVVNSAEQSIDFYNKAFGFDLVNKMEEDDKITHVFMTRGQAGIMFAPQGMWENPAKTPANTQTAAAMSLYIYCDDVDALHTQAVGAGAISIQEPTDTFWGDRMCQLTDADGYVWSFAKKIG